MTTRHTNGGYVPLLDIKNELGSGISHEHSLRQLRSLQDAGFDLISPEVMACFYHQYAPDGDLWSGLSTCYIAYFGPERNLQVYYPDLGGARIEHAARVRQGITSMPVHMSGQAGWAKGTLDARYYNPQPLGGTGCDGVRWREDACYHEYPSRHYDPWSGTEVEVTLPSLAGQFYAAIQRHQNDSPRAVSAWSLYHHVVNHPGH